MSAMLMVGVPDLTQLTIAHPTKPFVFLRVVDFKLGLISLLEIRFDEFPNLPLELTQLRVERFPGARHQNLGANQLGERSREASRRGLLRLTSDLDVPSFVGQHFFEPARAFWHLVCDQQVQLLHGETNSQPGTGTKG